MLEAGDLGDVYDFRGAYLQAGSSPGESAQGFRSVLVSESHHPFWEHWWPHGHIIGWEHTFVHELHHLLTAIRDDGEVAPHGATFEDGYRATEVCGAIVRSAGPGSGCSWKSVVDAGQLIATCFADRRGACGNLNSASWAIGPSPEARMLTRSCRVRPRRRVAASRNSGRAREAPARSPGSRRPGRSRG
jgi:hypothetical protein